MKPNRHIRSVLAGFLLLVFCVGITPKQVFHDLLTNHKHVPGTNHREATIDRTPSKYVCDLHDQVAESPFLPTVSENFDTPVLYLLPVAFNFSEHLFDNPAIHTALRGPPALA